MKNPIYEPKGPAREYARWGLNLYKGCVHGCLYCYVPGIFRKSREAFRTGVVPRPGILKALVKQLEAELGAMEGDAGADEPVSPRLFGGERVLLSFTSDPYQPIEAEALVTCRALALLKLYNTAFTVLTKGGLRAAEDFHAYAAGDAFAISLSSLDREYWREWEPGAAGPHERLEALKLAHEAGIATWVSIEPVNSLADTLEVIEAAAPWAGEPATSSAVSFKIGPDNHSKARRDAVDWRDFVEKVAGKCDSLGVRYTFKEDLCKLAVVSTKED